MQAAASGVAPSVHISTWRQMAAETACHACVRTLVLGIALQAVGSMDSQGDMTDCQKANEHRTEATTLTMTDALLVSTGTRPSLHAARMSSSCGALSRLYGNSEDERLAAGSRCGA